MKNSKEFLRSTANDYDMDIEYVSDIANISTDYIDFYERLEAFIKERANRH